MVAQIKRMEFIIVESEARALLVENELIKKFKPRYNILLKDDKSFPHLMIDVGSDFPCLRKYRGSRADKNKYFGPFASVMAVNSVAHFPHLMQLSWSMFSVILFLLLISKIKTPATIKITGVYI